MRTFKIGNWMIEWHFAIKKVTRPSVIEVAAEFLMKDMKLNALKAIKTEYDISLKECKSILDRICMYEDVYSNSNFRSLKFLIKKDKKTIMNFLADKLYKYDKR